MFNPVTKDGFAGWPHNDLEAALERAVTDASQLPALWPVLLKSTVHVVAQTPTEEEAADPNSGSRLALFTADDGHQAVMAFTSHEVARAAITGPTAITDSPVEFLVEHLGEVSLILNVSGPYGKELMPHELRAGRQGVTRTGSNQMHVAADTQVFFGALADEPHELVEAVVSACRGDETVKGAWLSGVCVPAAGDSSAHPLVGIDAEDFAGAKAKVSRAMGAWTSRERKPVDFVDMRQASAFATHLKKEGKRIYRKGGFLGGIFG